MSLKFLILSADYPEFLGWLYAQHPGLEKQPYDQQMQVRNESLFGVADFCSSNLRKWGHDAFDVHANNEFMQKAWAREHGMRIKDPAPIAQGWHVPLRQARRLAARTPLTYLKPFLRQVPRSPDSQQAWFYDILTAQIRYHKPDILLNQGMDVIGGRFLRETKIHVRLLVGQIAAPMRKGEDLSFYDLVISSLPNFVNYFRALGIPAQLHRLAFEPLVLSRLKDEEKTIPLSFVGSLFPIHKARIHWLEYLCKRLDVAVWGQGIDGLPKNSWIRRRYKGKAWGIEMYRVLHDSRMTINNHIDVAQSYANNMRLFEATGVGTLLITDWKANLHEMFEPGEEVVAYRSPEECVELVQYYLEHDKEREAIARAGQERTLREHTYYRRMGELVEIVGRYL